MKLPHREHAYIPREKITGYLLNPEHPKGRGKAKFFTSFGYSLTQWEKLKEALLQHMNTHDVSYSEKTPFGTRHVIEGKIFTPIGRTPKVRVVWFIEMSGTQPRLVTAYPIEVNDD